MMDSSMLAPSFSSTPSLIRKFKFYLSLENLGILYRELGYCKLQQVMHFYFFCQKHQLKYIHLSPLMSRFACSSKNCDFSCVAKNFCVGRDFSLFFVMLIITKPERVADLTKLAQIAKNR